MRLSREMLSSLCIQHSVPQDTDKLVSRFCIGLPSNHAHTAQYIVQLKQYTLWLKSEGFTLGDSNLSVLVHYAERLNECYFTAARKSIRILNIIKFLKWCAEHKFITYDDEGVPLSKDDLMSHPVFSFEPAETPLALYEKAVATYPFNSVERGYALLRVHGVTYASLTGIKIEQINLLSRLRVTLANTIIETPTFQDREDILKFLNTESKLNLTDMLPNHLQKRALIDKVGMATSIATGKYEMLIRLAATYATTDNPRIAAFIELHFPASTSTQRYHNCKDISLGKDLSTATGRITSHAIIDMYRERLPW